MSTLLPPPPRPARGPAASGGEPARRPDLAPDGGLLPEGVLMLPDTDHRPRWRPGERLHQLFEARCDALQAAGQADHLAVDSAQHRLSYAQLDALANQLARYLRGQGLAAGDVVGLLFDKSAWSYAAMLAVGKLHASYLPLDAGFPADRIQFIASDAGARWMLSTSTHQALLAATGLPVLCLDLLATTLAALPAGRLGPDEAGTPVGECCYTIYTSGSTGRPKGVPIDHGSIVNFVRVAAETYGYRPDDRVYQGLTLAFDFAVEEIWVPLVVGATLLPNQTGGSLLGQDLADFLTRQRATALCCVPTLLATLDDALPGLRLLIVSGEACPRDLVTRWHRPGRRFLNAYGPTEATVTATLGQPRPGGPVTIGRPLPSYAIAILAADEDRVLPFGAEGEITIAGIGIARGYLNRDEQTRKVFIPDFIGVPHNASGRLYRTGDLGRINADGEVEYLGRIDTQVKIRGYRIELAEIESLLLQRPEVAQAVVNPWASSPGVTELVAYLTLAPASQRLTAGRLVDASADPAAHPGALSVPERLDEGLAEQLTEQLAQHLRQHLPPYMVPAYFEVLASMPMLASDKADRKALPPPTRPRLQRGEAAGRVHAAPETPTERRLAEALAQQLQLPQVSVDDHFFDDLGANSLLLAHLSARLRTALAPASVSMRELYSHPTVRRLAGHLDAAQAVAVAAGGAASVLAGSGAVGSGAAGSVAKTPQGLAAAQALPVQAPHRASALAMALCGTAQLLLAAGWVGAHAAAWWWGLHWVIDAPGWASAWARAVASAAAWSGASVLLPVAAKWLLQGRAGPQAFPVWGWRYLRFWTVRELVRRNPVVALAGTPLYTLYLRLLGMQIGPGALVALRQPPACPDLVRVGRGAVVGRHVLLAGYHVVGGRVRTGPVHIGDHARVGEGSLLDIDTRIAEHGELLHASALLAGQAVPAGQCWHGSPAQPAPRAATATSTPTAGAGSIANATSPAVAATTVTTPAAAAAIPTLQAEDEAALRRAPGGLARRGWVYSLLQVLIGWCVLLPLLPLAAHGLWGDQGHALDGLGAAGTVLVDQGQALAGAEAGNGAQAGAVLRWLGLTWLVYLGGLAAGLVLVFTVPRWLSARVQPGRAYPLFGLHHALLRWATALSNVQTFHQLFGDSSLIVHYLRGIGYRFPQLRQTGSNFGMAQQHDLPTFNTFGSGTMVSDGLTMLNAEFGAQVFRAWPLALGDNSFVGNGVFVPPGHRLGDNCLLATKAMLPVDGPLREGVGLLGSPPMEIPRSVRRDAALAHSTQPDLLAQRLRLKNRHNAATMGLRVLADGALLSVLALAWHALYPVFEGHGAWFAAAFAVASTALALAWWVVLDGFSRRWQRLQPRHCSIHDADFWQHERHWKLGLSNDQPLLNLLNGTPFKAWAWRAMGVRVGRGLFDDGCAMPEKTLVSLGEYCTLGAFCTLQGHSLEDGIFKSDHIVVGDGCSVGSNAYVHYGVRLDSGAQVAPDAFVMKGEHLRAGERWRGNPAQWVG